jgi:hypothetical protein
MHNEKGYASHAPKAEPIKVTIYSKNHSLQAILTEQLKISKGN